MKAALAEAREKRRPQVREKIKAELKRDLQNVLFFLPAYWMEYYKGKYKKNNYTNHERWVAGYLFTRGFPNLII